jgi:hypothetical protein
MVAFLGQPLAAVLAKLRPLELAPPLIYARDRSSYLTTPALRAGGGLGFDARMAAILDVLAEATAAPAVSAPSLDSPSAPRAAHRRNSSAAGQLEKCDVWKDAPAAAHFAASSMFREVRITEPFVLGL